MDRRRVDYAELRAAVARALRTAGVSERDADVASRVIVEADACGRPSHGVARLPTYVDMLRRGTIDASAVVEVLHDDDHTFGIDGHDGLGEVAVTVAVEMAIERSTRSGIAMGLVRNINNPGMLAAYGMLAAEAGRILLLACNAAPAMAPHGGSQPWLGTNPLCIAIPRASGHPPILDMATSVAAKGVIRAAARDGRTIPVGWALDREGQPTTDPAAALAGTLLPIGGAKGSGLALMIDLISGVLAGSGSANTVLGLHDEGPSRAGAWVIAVDPARFMAPSGFEALLDGYLTELRAMPPAAGFEAVLVPGERAWRERDRSLAEGVPVADADWTALAALGVSDGRSP